MLLTALFDLSVVLWANMAGHQEVPQATDMDRFTMSHVEAESALLWVHFASVALKTGVVLVLLYRVRCNDARARPLPVLTPLSFACTDATHHPRQLSLWVAETQDRVTAERLRCPEGRTVLVSDVPGGADAARDAFAMLYPHAFVAAVPCIDPRAATALAAKRETLLHALESARWALDHSKRLSRDGVSLGRRPTHRTGFLGLVGPRVDSLDTYAAQLTETDLQLSATRAALLAGAATPDAPGRSAAFVTFATPRDAAVAAQAVLSRDPFTWRLAPAPPPADVFWPNVGRLPPLLQQAAAYITAAALYAMVVLYMVPIAAISALSTLSNLSRMLPFLKPIVKPPVIRALLEGLLPGLALLFFLALLPALIRALASARGVRTRSGLDVAELKGVFLFAVVNVFIGNVLAGSVLSGLKQVIDHPPGLFTTLATTIPQTSRFFMSFVALKAIGGAASEVSCVLKCLIYLLKTRLLGARRTQRREAAAWAPHATSLGSTASDTLLVLMLCIIFSTIAPLMTCVGVGFFLLRLGATKACVLYRHEGAYEGGAALWAPSRARVCAALLIYQATLAGVFGLKRAPVPAALCLGVLMPFTFAAMRAMAERFDPAIPGNAPPPLAWFAAEQAASLKGKAAASEAEPELVEEPLPDEAAAAFLPPALQPLPASELRALLKRDASAVSDLEHGAAEASALTRTRSAAAIEEEEEWHDPSPPSI